MRIASENCALFAEFPCNLGPAMDLEFGTFRWKSEARQANSDSELRCRKPLWSYPSFSLVLLFLWCFLLGTSLVFAGFLLGISFFFFINEGYAKWQKSLRCSLGLFQKTKEKKDGEWAVLEGPKWSQYKMYFSGDGGKKRGEETSRRTPLPKRGLRPSGSRSCCP